MPASAPASCIARTRAILVPTVQCVWSSSGLASGAACAAAVSSAVSAAVSSGLATPRPPHSGHRAVSPGWPPPNTSRPASVSRTGRDRSTTPRLRSSLQIAVTIGTGSSASWLTARTATGSVRLMARITSLTPAGPSASPVAAATSARTASAVLAMVMVPGSQKIRCARTRVARP